MSAGLWSALINILRRNYQAAFCEPKVSFIIHTAALPKRSNTPETTSMPTVSGAPLAASGKQWRMAPPHNAATICGTVIVQLNNPRYVPILPPDKAFVSMVNGIESIAAHAQPINA